MPNSASFFASGKLFIVGEYTVVNGRLPAILISTTKGIQVSMRASKKFKITNEQFQDHNQTFSSLAELKEPLIRLSVEVVRQYVQELKKDFTPFSLKIISHISSSEMKYGLGSSGALVVACIGCLLKFYGIKATPMTRYKLAVKAMLDHQTSSSYADLAVSSFNTPIYYKKFSDVFQSRLKTLSVMNAIDTDWEELVITPLKNHQVLKPIVIFTGVPASSSQFVSKVLPFLTEERRNAMMRIIPKMTTEHFLDGIKEAHAWLLELGEKSQQALYTDEMKEILEIIVRFGGATKFSGAGGGDCMIAYIPDKQNEVKALQLLNKKFKVLEGIIE